MKKVLKNLQGMLKGCNFAADLINNVTKVQKNQ